MPNVLAAAVAENPSPLTPGDALRELVSLISETRGCVHSPESLIRFAEWRGRAAESVVRCLKRNEGDPAFQDACSMIRELRYSGVMDYAVPPHLVETADSHAKRGWAGVIAGMILVPSWQWANAPRLRDVPLWMLSLMAEYHFYAPRMLTAPAQRAAFLQRHQLALGDLATLAEANRGSQAVRAALEFHQAIESAASHAFDGIDALDCRVARARLIGALHRAGRASDVLIAPREGRPLRVAVIARTFAPSPAVSSVISLVERLDPSRFELVLMSLDPVESEIEQHLISRGASRNVLGGTEDDMSNAARDAMLDVAVYVLEGAWSQSPIAPLCVKRSAPLQIVHDGTAMPSLLPGADLYFGGAADLPFTTSQGERRAVLPGLGAVELNETSSSDPADEWTREALGVDASSVVFTTVGFPGEFEVEALDSCAELMRRVPAARLVVCIPAGFGEATDDFCSRFVQMLSGCGVSEERVSVISDVALSTSVHRKNCLAGTDLVLDFTGRRPAVALAALEMGIPVVALNSAGAVPSGTSALLISAGLPQFSVTSHAELVRIAGGAAEASQLESLRNTVQEKAPAAVAMHDSFVRSESFGRLLEKAFDGLVQSRRAFERDRSPLALDVGGTPESYADEIRTFIDLGSPVDAEARARAWISAAPTSVEARAALARALDMRGRSSDASSVWVGIVELAPHDAGAWHELARTSWQAGRRRDAVQALETALRIDSKRVDSWLLLLTLAQESNDILMQQDATAVLKELAPDDPRVAELAPVVSA